MTPGGILAQVRSRLGRMRGAMAVTEPESGGYDRYPRWPVVVLAAGAFVAIWGGWVDLGRMAGFGPVNLLPGIATLNVDLSITLPLGMEVYSAYALGVWLTHRRIRPLARRFAGWSVLASLIIGAGGQVAYHLLSAAGVERAPGYVVVAVACVPVAVMGMGAALAHLLTVNRTKVQAAPAGSAAENRGSIEEQGPNHEGRDDADTSAVAVLDLAREGAGRAAAAVNRAGSHAWTTKEERDELIRDLWSRERLYDGRRLPHQAIADMVGTSKSTVTRAIQREAARTADPAASRESSETRHQVDRAAWSTAVHA